MSQGEDPLIRDLFQPHCFDLNVPAECTEWFLSVSRINKRKDDFQTDSAPDLAIIILRPRLWGEGRGWRGGERERETESGEIGRF